MAVNGKDTEAPEDCLVHRLAAGQHPVELILRPKHDAAALLERFEVGYIHVKFMDTTSELGVRIDRELSDMSGGDLRKGTGKIRICGRLVLDYVPVMCVAEIDVSTLAGVGHLDILKEVPTDIF